MRDLRTVRHSADLYWFHIKTISHFHIGRAQSNMMLEGIQRLSALAKSSEDASIRVRSPNIVQSQNTIWHAVAELVVRQGSLFSSHALVRSCGTPTCRVAASAASPSLLTHILMRNDPARRRAGCARGRAH
jgi:hypothetical protein